MKQSMNSQQEASLDKFQRHSTDTGSAEVQIVLLTAHISELSKHLTANPKDKHSKRGLQKLVARRKSLMSYLHRKKPDVYRELIQSLGIRG